MADDVQVKFGANIEGVIAGVNDVKAQIESLAESATSIRSTFAGIGTAVAELFAVDQIAGYAERMSDLGEQAIRMSSMLGMSVEQVQKLGFAAKMTGGDAEGMAMSMGRFERNIAEAQSGTGKAYEAFHNLGISLQDLKTKTPDQLLGQVANAFAGAADGATKYAYAVDLGGRTWGQMIPLLDQGSAGLERMGVIAQQTGSILTQEMAEAFAKVHQNIVMMDASLQGTSNTLFSAFIPAINAIVNGLSDLTQWFNEAAKSGGSMREIIILIEAAFDGLVMGIESGTVTIKMAIEGTALTFFDLKVTADVVVAAIKDLFVGLGRAIKDALTGNFGDIEGEYAKAVNQMKADWAAGMKEMSGAADEFGNDTIASWAKLQQRANEMWASLSGATPRTEAPAAKKPDLPPAPTGATGEDDSEEKEEIEIEKSDLQTKLELYKLDVAAKKDADDEKVASGQLSKQAELADLITLVGKERDLALQEIADEQDLYDRDSAQWEELNNKKLVVAQQYANELAKLNEQIAQANAESVKKTQEEYKSFFDTIDKSMDTALTGVLQGTEQWGTAVAKVFDHLAESFIEDIAKMLVKAAALQAVNLFSSGGNLSKAIGGEVPQALGGSQNNASNPLTAILTTLTAAITGNTAAQTLSGSITEASNAITQTTGTVVTGLSTATLANTTATIANTTAEGSSSGGGFFSSLLAAIPHYDTGTSFAPGGLSILHPGEIVIPPSQSAALRSGAASLSGGASGAGGQFNITIQAIDTQSGAQFLKNNAAVIAQTMSGQMRNFNPRLTA